MHRRSFFSFGAPERGVSCPELGWLLALVFAADACAQEEIYPGYRWQAVADGIFMHSSVNPLAGPVDGNSVVIVNEDEVVVVDTHINPAAARAVIQKIRQITDRPVPKIVNTHWHDDHTNGNHAYREAFPEASIISHKSTLATLKREWPPMEKQRQESYASVEAEQILEAADNLEDANQALGYRVYAGYVAALKPELPTLQLVYPDTVFEDQLVFKSGSRRIVVQWLGRGNTDGDAIIWLPDDELLITGDLLVAPIPYAFDSPMTDWIETLQRLSEKGAKIIVPGHGAVQHDTEYLQLVLTLLRNTVVAVRVAQENGTPFSALMDAVDLSDLEKRFTGGDAEKSFAWNSYFLAPGLESAWVSLGYPLPEEE
jgi:glyoxylase-like metal-dependent hydrolase (beta-lactamase superfamily II)